eukprot:7264772-Lingulodinium_polyedra.AAC.1
MQQTGHYGNIHSVAPTHNAQRVSKTVGPRFLQTWQLKDALRQPLARPLCWNIMTRRQLQT